MELFGMTNDRLNRVKQISTGHSENSTVIS